MQRCRQHQKLSDEKGAGEEKKRGHILPGTVIDSHKTKRQSEEKRPEKVKTKRCIEFFAFSSILITWSRILSCHRAKLLQKEESHTAGLIPGTRKVNGWHLSSVHLLVKPKRPAIKPVYPHSTSLTTQQLASHPSKPLRSRRGSHPRKTRAAARKTSCGRLHSWEIAGMQVARVQRQRNDLLCRKAASLQLWFPGSPLRCEATLLGLTSQPVRVCSARPSTTTRTLPETTDVKGVGFSHCPGMNWVDRLNTWRTLWEDFSRTETVT